MSTSNLLYSAVVLDDDNRAKLIKFVDGIIDISSTWESIAHHMTMGFKKPVPDHLRDDIGKSVQLNVTDLGISNDAIAVKVEGYHSDNEIPHITVAIPKDGKPFNSNLITKWYPVHQITLTGTVMEVKEMVDYKEIYLPNHRYIELYAEMAEAILQNFHKGKIQIEEERENGDIGFTEEAQDLYDHYCGLVEEVLERCYIFDGFEKEIY